MKQNENYEKKYKEALDRASHIKDYNTIGTPQEIAELIFPELRESEFEKNLEKKIKCYTGIVQTKNAAKQWAKELMSLAKKEQKQEWSEEDEYLMDETIQHLEQLIRIDKAKHCGVDVQYYQRDIDWLKSLRPQPKK